MGANARCLKWAVGGIAGVMCVLIGGVAGGCAERPAGRRSLRRGSG